MAVAMRLGDKICMMQNLSTTTLYRLSARSTPAALRNDIIHRLEIGERLSESEVQRQLAKARALQHVPAKQVKQGTPPEPSAHQIDDALTLIKQDWQKLTIEQQQEFLDWARVYLEDKSIKQPEPHSPHHDGLTVPTQTPLKCISQRCWYSRCSAEGHCLRARSMAALTQRGRSAARLKRLKTRNRPI
jgi:hypothetical protein